jgi:glycosyltransferase involved in cell wall biosynthesis
MKGMALKIPEISVVIAAYNKGNAIGFVLDSFRRQTLSRELFEVIVINHDSTDDTLDIIEKYQRQSLYNLRYYTLKRVGYNISMVRNAGIRLSRGEIILFLDGDIIASSQLLEEHVTQHHLGNKVVLGLIYGAGLSPNKWEEKNGEITSWPFDNPEKLFYLARESPNLIDQREIWLNNQNINYFKAPWLCFWTGNVSIDRDLLSRVGMFDEKMTRSGDLEMGYRLHKQKTKFQYSKYATGLHYPHPRDYVTDEKQDQQSELYLYEKYCDIQTEMLSTFGFNSVVDQIERAEALAKETNQLSSPISVRVALAIRQMIGVCKNTLLVGMPHVSYLMVGIKHATVWSPRIYRQAEVLDDTRLYNIIGVKLPFQSRYFEHVIIGDLWSLLDACWLKKIYTEASRTGKQVYLLSRSENIDLFRKMIISKNEIINAGQVKYLFHLGEYI